MDLYVFDEVAGVDYLLVMVQRPLCLKRSSFFECDCGIALGQFNATRSRRWGWCGAEEEELRGQRFGKMNGVKRGSRAIAFILRCSGGSAG